MSLRLVLTTTPDAASAQAIATALVEQQLAACVKAIPGAQATYRWEGKVVTDTEHQLLIKTRQPCLAAAQALVTDLHPYEVHEWLVLDAVSASQAYGDWVIEQTPEATAP